MLAVPSATEPVARAFREEQLLATCCWMRSCYAEIAVISTGYRHASRGEIFPAPITDPGVVARKRMMNSMILGEGITGGVTAAGGPDRRRTVIDLSIDSAEFRNEVPRIKNCRTMRLVTRTFSGRMQRFLDKQTEATRRTSASPEQVTASSTAYSSSVEKKKKRMATRASGGGCDQTRQRVE